MGTRLYINNFSTKLTAQLLVAGTTANITLGDGARLAGANGTDWFVGTLRRMTGYKDVAREIVKVTNRATDALTIVRAQESTSALQFEVGDQLDIDFTAASLAGVANLSGFADNETPGGTINGSNVTFTLANTPLATPMLFLNGLLQLLTTHFTISGTTITFVVAATPQTGDNLRAFYRY